MYRKMKAINKSETKFIKINFLFLVIRKSKKVLKFFEEKICKIKIKLIIYFTEEKKST